MKRLNPNILERSKPQNFFNGFPKLFSFPSWKLFRVLISDWFEENLISTSVLVRIQQHEKDQIYCGYYMDGFDLQFTMGRYMDIVECKVSLEDCGESLGSCGLRKGVQHMMKRCASWNYFLVANGMALKPYHNNLFQRWHQLQKKLHRRRILLTK